MYAIYMFSSDKQVAMVGDLGSYEHLGKCIYINIYIYTDIPYYVYIYICIRGCWFEKMGVESNSKTRTFFPLYIFSVEP